MIRRSYLSAWLLVACVASLSWGQANSAKPPAASEPLNIHTPDDPDVLRETQLTVGTPGYSGLVWWIPYEFWGRAAARSGQAQDKGREAFKSLREYTVVGLMLAKVTQLGSFEYSTPAELQKKAFLRDANGNEYPAMSEVTGDAKMVADLMRPILSNALGRAGENFAMIFFPARDRNGKLIADALSKGQFSVVLKDAVGEPETVYLWRTPLTSFSAPRYCPIGKERLHANWEYCPWHGVKISDNP